VELEFVLVFLVFLKVFWGKVFEGLKIKRALFINTLVNVKVFALLLLDKDSAAIRAYQSPDFEIFLILVKPKPADLAQELTTAAGIIIEVYMRSTAAMADNIMRNRVFTARLDGF
jgi:predicted HTH transcriptional regulator